MKKIPGILGLLSDARKEAGKLIQKEQALADTVSDDFESDSIPVKRGLEQFKK